jgi:hypothetical protein
MRMKLAGTLVLGDGFVVWSCGTGDATQTRSYDSAGSGGSVSGTGAVATGGAGIGGAKAGSLDEQSSLSMLLFTRSDHGLQLSDRELGWGRGDWR